MSDIFQDLTNNNNNNNDKTNIKKIKWTKKIHT